MNKVSQAFSTANCSKETQLPELFQSPEISQWPDSPNLPSLAKDLSSNVKPLDPLTFPLRGRGLIEASAGTGKTWTIAVLYLRLVLGHSAPGTEHSDSAPTAFLRPLAPSEILVMTFTDAATQELRERIRLRLIEAARFFGDPQLTADGVLEDLRKSYEPKDWPNRATLLRLAADSMDDAAIFTLHGWAGKVLREHALASGAALDEAITPNEGYEVEQLALHDFWRKTFYPLDDATAQVVWGCFSGVQKLWKAVKPLLKFTEKQLRYQGKDLPDLADLGPIFEHLSSQWASQDNLQNQARKYWRAERVVLEATWQNLRPFLNGNTYRGKADDTVFNGWLSDLAKWSDGDIAPEKIGLFSFSGAKINNPKAKKGQQIPTLPKLAALVAIDDWVTARTQMDASQNEFKAVLTAAALRWVRIESVRLRTQRSEIGFDDLIARLDDALAGSFSTRLAQRLRTQFPVALIDEFQDTDPAQYRILQKIYGNVSSFNVDSGSIPDSQSTSSALLLVGDPKQAIYSFRGADIHTYLAARADALAAQGTQACLEVNYRSTEALTSVVNHLFERADTRPKGAFGFKQEDGYDPVAFKAVRAHGRTEQLWINGQKSLAMTLWSVLPQNDDTALGIPDYRAQMAQVFATQVAHWLSHTEASDPLRCGFMTPDGNWQPLQSRDIAVLVRTGTEANLIRSELSLRGVSSVFLSEKSSVFDSQEARDVVMWLKALVDPNDDVLLHQALATPTMALTIPELTRLARDDLALEDAARRWLHLHDRWQRHGVLTMMQALIIEHGLPARLLGTVGGERSLTNVLHLAEWLQERSSKCDGPRALLRALQENVRDPQDSKEYHLRLESDETRLQVVTIHKSKGLEYPLVLLPFIAAWIPQSSNRSSHYEFYDRQTHSKVAELGGKNASAVNSENDNEDERLAEDMRLLYVALTRARHAQWLGVAPLAEKKGVKNPKLETSALGQTLGQGSSINSIEIYEQVLAQTCAGQTEITVQPAPDPDDFIWHPQAPDALKSARVFQHKDFEPWWIASYTALTRELRYGDVHDVTQEGDSHASNLKNKDPAFKHEDFYDAAAEMAWEAVMLKVPQQAQLSQANSPHQQGALDVQDALDTQDAQDAFVLSNDIQAQPDLAFYAGPLALSSQTTASQDFQNSQNIDPSEQAQQQTSEVRHMFSRGADAGAVLHSLLQWCAQHGFARVVNDSASLRDQVARRLAVRGWTQWIDPLHGWILECLQTPLALAGSEAPVPLTQLGTVTGEMEFWLPVERFDVRNLDALIREHIWPGQPRPDLSEGVLAGVIRGYIDLSFAQDHRYAIIDYKTHRLGAIDSDYDEPFLREVMLANRYDVQAALYLLALHRLLASRLADYEPARHLSGANYWFLRGVRANAHGLITLPASIALIQALDAALD
jgi:exodeoxyribonuclease V beta subunit